MLRARRGSDSLPLHHHRKDQQQRGLTLHSPFRLLHRGASCEKARLARKTRLFLETVSFLQSLNLHTMEVIIDYYGEEYPCYIYPDKTVKENIQAIAVCWPPCSVMRRNTFPWMRST